jgi:hypothetical protein
MVSKKITDLGRYYSNKSIRKKVDKLLHKNSIIQSNLGIDSTKAEKDEAKAKTKEIYNNIKSLDSVFAKNAFPEYQG